MHIGGDIIDIGCCEDVVEDDTGTRKTHSAFSYTVQGAFPETRNLANIVVNLGLMTIK
jgi:hypothetical protein